MEEVGFDSAFTFVFSPRNGTQAAGYPDQIPEHIAKERIQRLIALQERKQKECMQRFIQSEESVLVEGISRRNTEEVSGHGAHGISVTFPGNERDIGTIVNVRIETIMNNTLRGTRIP